MSAGALGLRLDEPFADRTKGRLPLADAPGPSDLIYASGREWSRAPSNRSRSGSLRMVRRASLGVFVVLWFAWAPPSRAAQAGEYAKTLQWRLFTGREACAVLTCTSDEMAEARSARFGTYRQYVHCGAERINSLVRGVRDSVRPKDEAELVEAIAALVQSIEYRRSPDRHAPLATLDAWRGDCEDKCILAAALLEAAGIRTVLLAFRKSNHMAVGADLSRKGVWGVELDGIGYTLIECSGYGWKPGAMPPDLDGQVARVFRIASAEGAASRLQTMAAAPTSGPSPQADPKPTAPPPR